MPHIHMCVTLRTKDNRPDDWDEKKLGSWIEKELTPEEYIDEYISAELPERPSKEQLQMKGHKKGAKKTDPAVLQEQYYQLVANQMYHTCSTDYCLAEGICQKRFPVIELNTCYSTLPYFLEKIFST